jgi:hypothetical protein
MRLDSPRITPVDVERLTDEQREALAPFMADAKDGTRAGGRVLNIF